AFVLAGQLAIMSFVVLFLHDARGFSTAHAAFVLAVVQVGGVAMRIAAGRRSDRERRRSPLFARLSVALALALGVAAALLYGRLADRQLVELRVDAPELARAAVVAGVDARRAHRQRIADRPQPTEPAPRSLGCRKEIGVDLDVEHVLHAADVTVAEFLDRVEE